jgi:hypothetical protein
MLTWACLVSASCLLQLHHRVRWTQEASHCLDLRSWLVRLASLPFCWLMQAQAEAEVLRGHQARATQYRCPLGQQPMPYQPEAVTVVSLRHTHQWQTGATAHAVSLKSGLHVCMDQWVHTHTYTHTHKHTHTHTPCNETASVMLKARETHERLGVHSESGW